MVDIIGPIASTMTIAAVVLEGGQVEQLSLLVEEIRCQDVASTSAIIATTLLKAKVALEKLNRLIQAKLIKNIHGTSRARRRVWARSKSKVKGIQNELQGHMLDLIAAMSALNTSSAIRSEAMLESISHNISHSKQVSLSLDQHLLDIKHAVTRTHKPVSSQNATQHYPRQTIFFKPAPHLTSPERLTPLPLPSSEGHKMAAVGVDSHPRREQLIPRKGTTCVYKTSIYWAATRVSKEQLQIKQITTSSRSLQLPYSLQNRIQATLSRAQDRAEDSDLKLRIIDQNYVQAENDESHDNLSLGTERLASSCYSPMAFLNDLGCDQYLEDEVIQVQMLDPPSRFASCINGAMV
ncbi:MAG: hypothetical protein LQ351_004563 [Letrouitia transgressa]|nr:MAG: hypothetical protein LQ351_004563 [Letrouitia transgressa]